MEYHFASRAETNLYLGATFLVHAQSIQLHFSESAPPIEFESVSALDASIDSLHSHSLSSFPLCVEIRIPGFAIDFGIGTDTSFLLIQVAPCDGEYYHSIGDEQAKGSIDYFGCGNHTPFERRMMIPFALVREGIRAFLESRVLTNEIRWVDWAGNPAPTRL